MFHILQRFMRHSRLRVGTLTFWGPPEFLSTCRASVERLQSLDPELHKHVTERERLCFYYSGKRLEQALFPRSFSINDGYADWHSDGIISRLVYAAFLANAFPRQVINAAERPAARASHRDVITRTGAWLAARSFPEPWWIAFKRTFPTAITLEVAEENAGRSVGGHQRSY
jgi:hypothetical protein